MTASAQPANQQSDLGLYVHWPFCARVCPYCDFNVYRNRREDVVALHTALLRDLHGHRDRLGARPLTSIHFGGGTPSLLEPKLLAEVIDTAQALFGFVDKPEIALEANPNDIDKAKAKAWAQAGIERLSIGVQSLNDRALKELGRDHHRREAIAGLEAARGLIPRISGDFIYALPGQTLKDWRRALTEILSLGLRHLSLYQLTFEGETPFAKAAESGKMFVPPPDLAADLYNLTQELTAEAGMPAYEVSNHAPDRFHHARHNLLYWHSQDWIGIGPGAHGRLTTPTGRMSTSAVRDVATYIARVQVESVGWDEAEILTPAQAESERIIMGLRVSDGIQYPSGSPFDARLAEVKSYGWIKKLANGNIALTAAGRLFADRAAAILIG